MMITPSESGAVDGAPAIIFLFTVLPQRPVGTKYENGLRTHAQIQMCSLSVFIDVLCLIGDGRYSDTDRDRDRTAVFPA